MSNYRDPHDGANTYMKIKTIAEDLRGLAVKMKGYNIYMSGSSGTGKTTYARTNIENDIVFVPCYTGNYEDFDSKAMLVNTGNQNNNVIGNTKIMTDNVKDLLMNSFPDSFSQDDKTYTTLSKNFDTNGERYGLVKFSRDLDPFEAGELRVNEMPYAIRLSKLMEVISNPINNGGYEVEWDESIKLSPYWLYSFVLMNKLKKEKNDVIGYDITTPPLDNVAIP